MKNAAHGKRHDNSSKKTKDFHNMHNKTLQIHSKTTISEKWRFNFIAKTLVWGKGRTKAEVFLKSMSLLTWYLQQTAPPGTDVRTDGRIKGF